MDEAEISGQKLAKVINDAGREIGLTLCYDRRSAGHWRRGHQPRPPVPDLAAEAFSRMLGRRIAVAETGFAGDGAGPAESAAAAGRNLVEELVGLREFADHPGRRTPVPPV